MRRSTPFFSPISIIIAVVVFISLGITLWVNGGLGFSPGPVSARSVPGVTLQGFTTHADFEKECSRCHQPLNGEQAILCLDCHSDIAADRSGGDGFHGKLDPAEACFSCHPEHKGRAFDLVSMALNDFDHSQTNFILDGKHLDLDCEACHPAGVYRLGTIKCSQCHAEPDVHTGMFGSDCENCHSTPGWEAVLIEGKPFDHDQVGFTLEEHSQDFDGKPIQCRVCHQGSTETNRTEACINCHGSEDADFIAEHRRQFGDACLECHNGSDDYAGFDHSQIFPLEGEHAGLDCADCHQDRTFDGTPTECASCHTEPEAHLRMFGMECTACHTPNGWIPASINGSPFDHEQLSFRLNKHDENFNDSPIACTDCHFGPAEDVGSDACIQCHGEAEPEFTTKHQRDFGTNCLGCHDGTDRFSDFNHARFFQLSGGHAGLKCASCHANLVFSGVPTHCAGCHGEPAYHAGLFGVKCQDCHSVNAWTPASLPGHDFPLDHGEQGRLDCRTCHPSSLQTYTCSACHDGIPEEDGGGDGDGGGGNDD